MAISVVRYQFSFKTLLQCVKHLFQPIPGQCFSKINSFQQLLQRNFSPTVDATEHKLRNSAKPAICAKKQTIASCQYLLNFLPSQHLGGRIWYVVALWWPNKADYCMPTTAKQTLIRCSSDKQFANSEYFWCKRYFVCWTSECRYWHFLCMHDSTVRHVTHHCTLTKTPAW